MPKITEPTEVNFDTYPTETIRFWYKEKNPQGFQIKSNKFIGARELDCHQIL